MPPQRQDEPPPRSRPRSNTSFMGTWRLHARDGSQLPSSPAAPRETLPIDALIQNLSPPAVPSLTDARSLVKALSDQASPPAPAFFTPILSTLCSGNSATAFQAVGFEIMAAYCGCFHEEHMSSDRKAWVDIMRASPTKWEYEVWIRRFKAFEALVKEMSKDEGSGLLGMEYDLLSLLQSWIQAAVSDVMAYSMADGLEREQKDDMENFIESLGASYTTLVVDLANRGLLSEEGVIGSFGFLALFVNEALRLPFDHTQSPLPLSPSRDAPPPNAILSPKHRRHQSSNSIPTLSSIATASPPKPSDTHPLYMTASMYLNHLEMSQALLPPSYLNTLLPTLFRILGIVLSPLPVVSLPITPRGALGEDALSLEQRVVKVINTLINGDFSAKCMNVLKVHLLPPDFPPTETETTVSASVGAHRTLRLQVRQELEDRLAMSYFNRDVSSHISPSGVPSSVSFDQEILERAQRGWRREASTAHDARRLGSILKKAVKAWIGWAQNPSDVYDTSGRQAVLLEVAGLLRDILKEIDDRTGDLRDADDGNGDELTDRDEGHAFVAGEVLEELVKFVKLLKRDDGSPIVLPLSRPNDAPTPLLRTLGTVLQLSDPGWPAPQLSSTLLSIADHLVDSDTEKIPLDMFDRKELTPADPAWLENWRMIMDTKSLFGQTRLLTRQRIMSVLQDVHASVVDIPMYRRPLMQLVFKFWERLVEEDNEGPDATVMWKLLGDEVVLRAFEEAPVGVPSEATTMNFVTKEAVFELMGAVAGRCEYHLEDESTMSPEAITTSPQTPFSAGALSGSTSPVTPRTMNDIFAPTKEKEFGSLQFVSRLFSAGNSTKSQVQSNNVSSEDVQTILPGDPSSAGPGLYPVPLPPQLHRSVPAIAALIDVFTKIAFADRLMTQEHTNLASMVYDRLLSLLSSLQCPPARLAILQFLLRLRADRDHRVYMKAKPSEDRHIVSLAMLIDRGRDAQEPSFSTTNGSATDVTFDDPRSTRARPAVPERDGRKSSRGRATRPSESTSSRSRSRLGSRAKASTKKPPSLWHLEKIWFIPDVVPFSVMDAGKVSPSLRSYDPQSPESKTISVSHYLDILIGILGAETDWEILSYVLVHLPTQLANKHFWCGSKTRLVITRLATELCKGILENKFGSSVPPHRWPEGLRVRDAQGLAFHTLSVLISYQNDFETKIKHGLMETFQAGLSSTPPTILCCLRALSLGTFEMPSIMVKYLPRILEKLSQIMTNPSLAVHILNFLSVVASIPSLYANFTDHDYKMVFRVALEYLLHHNRPETLAQIRFALGQHVRILSFYIVYVWFLAIKLPDRPYYIKSICRQLLLANEGRDEVDESTEVCFDWLARYTYASADPKASPSPLEDILDKPAGSQGGAAVERQQKSWLIGHTILTIRTLATPGWMEVVTRRASGTTKFLCKNENVPLVGLGDPDPDMRTVPGVLMMDKLSPSLLPPSLPDKLHDPPDMASEEVLALFSECDDDEEAPPRPDPITGYVWSGIAPSQRRKKVDMDPSFLPLQLSGYPDISSNNNARIVRGNKDQESLKRLFSTLDYTPVIDTHKVGILYVAPGQTDEVSILKNTHGSPAYTRFLEGIGRLIKLEGQVDVYVGGLDPATDGEYAYAWWDDIGQILYHTATLIPNFEHDAQCVFKKRHIGNDFVRIIWNDSGLPYRFETLATDFQFVNVVIEPHSHGAIAAYSDNIHENEYFKVMIQCAEGMVDFSPIGDFKIVSAASLPALIRQVSLLADWYASVFQHTNRDKEQNEFITNWRRRLHYIKNFAATINAAVTEQSVPDDGDDIAAQEALRDFTSGY